MIEVLIIMEVFECIDTIDSSITWGWEGYVPVQNIYGKMFEIPNICQNRVKLLDFKNSLFRCLKYQTLSYICIVNGEQRPSAFNALLGDSVLINVAPLYMALLSH